MRAGEQPLWKKGCGRLIHVSDFINSQSGRLVAHDEDRKFRQDARRIIYPGANGDSWWTNENLLDQMKSAVEIHNKTSPEYQALFIFDNSSAHASLPPDALKAFEMNKSDSGKQWKQHDTILSQSNPDVTKRGLVQKMTTTSGVPKGLKTVLEAQGFDVTGLKTKYSPLCPFESTGCCMARLLSQQDDFINQVSMLEKVIYGHWAFMYFSAKVPL